MKSGWQKLETQKQAPALKKFSANAGAFAAASKGGGNRLQDSACRRLATVNGVLIIGVRSANDALNVELNAINPTGASGITPVSMHDAGAGETSVIAGDEYDALTLTAGVKDAYCEVTADPTFRGERTIVAPLQTLAAPLADAGTDQAVAANAQVTLTAALQTEPQRQFGSNAEYVWTLTSGTVAAFTALSEAARRQRVCGPFSIGSAGAKVFTLTVIGRNGVVATDTITVTAS